MDIECSRGETEGSRWRKSLAKAWRLGALGAESVRLQRIQYLSFILYLSAVDFAVVGKNYTNVLQINTHALRFRSQILNVLSQFRLRNFYVCQITSSGQEGDRAGPPALMAN